MNTLIVYATMAMLLSGLYLVLSFRFWKVIVGLLFLSHSANLVLLASGGFFDEVNPPIVMDGVEFYMDPLPQALILTAIVIGFGMTVFVMMVLRQTFLKTGTTDLDEIERDEWRAGEDHHE